MLIEPYLIAKVTGTSTFLVTFLENRSEITTSGEPSSHHIFLYAAPDFFGLICKIIPFISK